MDTLLICTVGGAPAPIVTAIQDYQPAHVIFITSMQTPTSRMSSTEQVTKEILPQIGMSDDQYTIQEVNPDDLMHVYTVCCAVIRQMQSRYAIVADYTGGTKTMSAGLTLAVRQFPNVKLSMVAGMRKDLSAQYNMSVSAMRQPLTPLHVEDAYVQVQKLFDVYEYRAALEITKATLRDYELDENDRMSWQRLRKIIEGFNAWDSFMHKEAFDILQPQIHNSHQVVFKALLNVKTNHGYELTHDLLANAGRRAQQGKYDDAVARIYRALEALAQTRLKKEYEIDTAHVASATIQAYAKYQIPAKFTGRDTFELGMISAYELLQLFDDAVGKTWTAYDARIRDNIQFRNNSILAHGFTPVTAVQYTGFRQLVDAFVGDIRKNNVKIGDSLPPFPTLTDLLALQG
jgi:hypothetical protein